MIRSSFLIIGLVLGFALSARADEPPRLLSVEQWIEQLGHHDFQKREQAARAIEAVGVEALPALRKARTHLDPEIRKRVEQWIPGLERTQLLSPKLVSLHVKDKPLRDALAEIAGHTGYKLELFQNAAREKEVHTFDFDRIPFWEALDRLCEASGAVAQPSYGDEVIRLHYQDRYAPFVSRHGPFRMAAQSLDYGRSIQFATLPRAPAVHDPHTNEFLRFNLSISAEPRLPLLGLDEPRILEAYDDQKQHMVPPATNAAHGPRRISHYYGGYRTNTMTTQVSLGNASRGATTIKQLRGVIPVTLIAEQKDVVVADQILKAKGTRAPAGNLLFEIREVTEKPNKQVEVKMLIANQAKEAGTDFNWYNSLYYRTQLRDENGNKFNIAGSNMSINNNNTSANVTFTFGHAGGQGAGTPARLVYLDWTTLQHEVPFEFKDLPLP